jgi:stage V sporulation protein AC
VYKTNNKFKGYLRNITLCNLLKIHKKEVRLLDKNYKQYVDEISPKPKYLKNYTLAFIVGGIICVIGQGINDFYSKFINLEKLNASSATCITLIFIGALLT